MRGERWNQSAEQNRVWSVALRGAVCCAVSEPREDVQVFSTERRPRRGGQSSRGVGSMSGRREGPIRGPESKPSRRGGSVQGTGT